MAGEIGHVVYAARLLTHLGPQVRDPLYWVGTLFPNIRHFGVKSRLPTHPFKVGVRSLVTPSDFETGMRVHTWIDATRRTFLYDAQIKDTLPWHPLVPFCLNLLEDELLYQHFEDWNLIHRLLNTVHTDELRYLGERRIVERWHTLLQRYFKERPNADSRKIFTHDMGLSEAMARESENVLQLLKEDGRAEKLLERFWFQLEDLLR